LSSLIHLANIKVKDDYETPYDLYYDACQKFKIFPKLDVSATPKNSKCANYYTPEEDGLTKDWNKTFFCNPPYSRVSDFIKKAYYDSKKFQVEGFCLIFAKTDTKFWHSFIENKAEVHFIKGRIKFLRDGFKTKNSAPYPSCFVIYRLECKKELKVKKTAKFL